MRKNLLLGLLLAFSVSVMAQDMKLWYSRPAQVWTDALPIGNSRMGAMVFGGVDKEELQLNEETFWAGGPHNNLNATAHDALDDIRQLVFADKCKEAQDKIDKTFFTGQHGMRFLPLGSLRLTFDYSGVASDAAPRQYTRALNLANATATVNYAIGDVEYSRTAFASLADNVIVLRVEANKPKALSFGLGYDCAKELNPVVEAKGSQLTMRCTGVEQEGIKAALNAECRIVVKADGKIKAEGKAIAVKDASVATVFIIGATNFVNYHDVTANAATRCSKILKPALKMSYEELLARHTEKYRQQYDRVQLNIPMTKASEAETDERVRLFNQSDDLNLIALLYQYGRDLLVAAWRTGGKPSGSVEWRHVCSLGQQIHHKYQC